MTRFPGCLVVPMLFLFCITTTPVIGRHDENPLVELSSRSELVELAGYGEEKLSSVVVTGAVLCEACLDGNATPYTSPVSGAMVAISCKNGRKKMKNNWAKDRTNEYGDFVIDLPSHLHAIPFLDKACVVRVLRLPENSPCKRAPIGKFKKIRLSSAGNNLRTYTVGSIRLHRTSTLSRRCIRRQADGGNDTTW